MSVKLDVVSGITKTVTIKGKLQDSLFSLEVEKNSVRGILGASLSKRHAGGTTFTELPHELELLVQMIEAALRELDSAAE